MNTPDRTQMPALQEISAVKFPAIHSFALDNGMPLYVVPFGQAEVAEVRLVFREGKFLEDTIGQAAFTASLLNEGTRDLSALRFAEEVDFYGAMLSSESSWDSSTVSLSTLSKHLSPTLELMREAAFFPRLAEDEFNLQKRRRQQTLEIDEKQTGFVARREFNRLMFGATHAYGSAVGRKELEALDISHIRAFHSRMYGTANAFFVVSGDTKPDAAFALLNSVFGSGLPQGAGADRVVKAAPVFHTGYHHLPMAESTQSTVRMGHPGFSRLHPDHYPMMVVNTVLGGYFGSRLMENIREQKGYTYGIGSAWMTMKESGFFLVQTDCANAYAEDVRREVKKEITLLIEEGVTEEELRLVKNYMLGSSISSRETPGQIAETLSSYLINGVPLERVDERYEAIRSMTPEKVQAAAQKHLHPDNLLEVVCGKG